MRETLKTRDHQSMIAGAKELIYFFSSTGQKSRRKIFALSFAYETTATAGGNLAAVRN